MFKSRYKLTKIIILLIDLKLAESTPNERGMAWAIKEDLIVSSPSGCQERFDSSKALSVPTDGGFTKQLPHAGQNFAVG